MKTWLCSLLVLSFFLPRAYSQEPFTLEKLIDDAASNQSSAFANSYLAEKFTHWNRRFQLQEFTVDTVWTNTEFEEVWLSKEGQSPASDYSLAIQVSKSLKAIVDVRRLLVKDRSSWQANDREVLGFIERFVWTYEVGIDDFMLDFLFPAHVTVNYDGLKDPARLLARLRKQFTRAMPIQSIDWQNQGTTFDISLTLNAPFKSLQLSMDLRKYLTAHSFDMVGKSEKVRALADSIRIWLGSITSSSHKSLSIRASSASDALSSVLDLYFTEYNVTILRQHETDLTMELARDVVYGFKPTGLKYHLSAKSNRDETYTIEAVRLPLNSELNTNTSGLTERDVLAADRVVHRYTALGLPQTFRITGEEKRAMKGQVVLHSANADSFRLDSLKIYHLLLKKLSQAKEDFFFLREVRKDRRGRIVVRGYAIWQDRQQKWHHLVDVRETFDDQETPTLQSVRLDIFPFIRTDYLEALLASAESDSSRGASIQINK